MFQRTILANGLCVLSAPMPHTRSVTFSAYVGAGSRYERPDEAGISHFVEHICFKGTERRPSARDISEEVDNVGGILNGGTDREYTTYYIKVARPHFQMAADLVVDIMRQPLFDAEDFEKERKVIIEELASVADSPSQQCEVLLDSLLWPDQPLGWDVGGTEDTVSTMSRDEAINYMGRQYAPNNLVISVAGDVEHEEVVNAVGALTADWPLGRSVAGWYPAVNGQNEPRCGIIYKKTEQAHISLALRGVASTHPDRYALSLLSVVLGEGMSSRLFLELREKRGLVYDVHSYVTNYLDSGSFTVYAAVDPEDGIEALQVMIHELAQLRDGLPRAELQKAKEVSKGRLLLRMEDTRSVSSWLGAQELLWGEVKTPEEIVKAIDRVTEDDMQRVAEKLLATDKLNLAVVGPYKSEGRFLSLLAV
ncbi:MAG TPA: pitrilysin family protein [Dehalococcoidia bacterium]|nr:pitrilysin family protein [Dehalococcoidia bacterium]